MMAFENELEHWNSDFSVSIARQFSTSNFGEIWFSDRVARSLDQKNRTNFHWHNVIAQCESVVFNLTDINKYQTCYQPTTNTNGVTVSVSVILGIGLR